MKTTIKIFFTGMIMLLAATMPAQSWNWWTAQFGNTSNLVANPYYLQGEKSIVKNDPTGNVYVLSNPYDAASGYYKPRLIKFNSIGGGVLWTATVMPGMENYYVVDLEVGPDGHAYCLYERTDYLGYRMDAYDANGNYLLSYEGYPEYITTLANISFASDMQLYNNKLYFLETAVYPVTMDATAKITTLNLLDNTIFYYDTIAHINAYSMDVNASGLFILGNGNAYSKSFVDIIKMNSSGHLVYDNRTGSLFPARSNKSEIPIAIKCSPSGVPFVIGQTYLNSNVNNLNKYNFFIFKVKGATGTGSKLKEFNLAGSKEDHPCGLGFSSTGNLMIGGYTGKQVWAGRYDPATLAATWTSIASVDDSAAFSAMIVDGDEIVGLGGARSNANNLTRTIGMRFNYATGAYGPVNYGVFAFNDERFIIQSATFDAANDHINCAGVCHLVSPVGDFIYTTQFAATNFVRLQNEPIAEEAECDQTISLYPNPVTDKATVAVHVPAGAYQLNVINLMGEMVLQSEIELQDGNNSLELDASSLAPGIYILNVAGDNIKQSLRFVKQ